MADPKVTLCTPHRQRSARLHNSYARRSQEFRVCVGFAIALVSRLRSCRGVFVRIVTGQESEDATMRVHVQCGVIGVLLSL